MNKDILAGNWKQIKGEIRRQWGELTNDEIDQVAGEYEKMVGLLQERYGFARERAEQEVDEFLADY